MCYHIGFCFFYWDVFLPLHGKNTLYTDPHCAHKLGLFPKGLSQVHELLSSNILHSYNHTTKEVPLIPLSQELRLSASQEWSRPANCYTALPTSADLVCPPAALQDTFPQHCLPATFPTLTLNSLVFLVTFLGGKAGSELCLKSTTSYPNSIHQETSPTPIRMESSFPMGPNKNF